MSEAKHPEDGFAVLLQRWRQKRERRAERDLVQQHQHHFTRRVRAFDRGFFPGGEKSEEAFTSLGHGAFTSFDQEPVYEGAPAFDNVLQRQLPALGYLYRWRSSATVQFLKREGPEALQARFRLRRNVQIHLREGFEVMGLWQGQRLWAPAGAALGERTANPDLSSLEPKDKGLRGKALVGAVILAAGVPLNRDEIARVLERMEGVSVPVEVSVDSGDGPEGQLVSVEPSQAAVDAQRLAEQVQARVDRFFDRLSDKQRRLLLARGWADDRPQVSFKEAARRHGAWSEESCWQHERKLLESLARHFQDVDELQAAGRLLATRLKALATQELP